MGKLYNRLLELLNISGRDLAVFLLALLLAFSTWMIHNLSLKYNDYLTSSVIAQCNLEGHSDLSINSSDVVARCRATGYQALTSHIRSNHKRPVTVNFSPSVMRYMKDDLFYVLSSDLTEYGHLIYGEGVTLEYFVSDTLFFRFPEVDHKKVPVQPVYSISFADQYMGDGHLKAVPDSVTLYGESHRLASIDKVFTEPVKYVSLTSDIQGIVGLEPIGGVRMSHDEVHYLLDVTRYVEIKRNISVRVVNVPMDKKMHIFPSMATISAKLTFPLVDSGYENLELQVDYEDYVNSLSGKCPVKLSSVPNGLISYEVDPIAVSCLLEDK